MNIRGYLRWQFRGTLSSLMFYAWLLMLAGVILALFGMPWSLYVAAVGAALVFIDAARSWFRFSYGTYEMERQRIERELQRKQ